MRMKFELFKLKPHSADFYLMRSILLLLISSLLFFSACDSEADKKEATQFFLRGNQKFKEKENYEAIKWYNEAILKQPEFSDAYFNRGLVYQSLEKNERLQTLSVSPTAAFPADIHHDEPVYGRVASLDCSPHCLAFAECLAVCGGPRFVGLSLPRTPTSLKSVIEISVCGRKASRVKSGLLKSCSRASPRPSVLPSRPVPSRSASPPVKASAPVLLSLSCFRRRHTKPLPARVEDAFTFKCNGASDA